MSDLVVCSAAEAEYAQALVWYAERSPTVAKRFEADISRALTTIVSHPDRFPRFDDRHHFYLLRDFPYQIIYRQQGNRCIIIAFAHSARRPGYWSGR
jgi:plasmid stabilization system protein ParE